MTEKEFFILNFNPGKKNLSIKKYPDSCGGDLPNMSLFQNMLQYINNNFGNYKIIIWFTAVTT